MSLKRSRLSGRIPGRFVERFVAGASARTAGEFIGANHNTTIFFSIYYKYYIQQRALNKKLSGAVKVDESSFNGYRRGTRGRGAAGKMVVFGILK